MKKYIKDLKENEVILAPTIEIAEKLCKKFDELGLTWCNGCSYTEENYWKSYRQYTVYCPFEGKYSDIDPFASRNASFYTIDNLKDFDEDNKYDSSKHLKMFLGADPYKSFRNYIALNSSDSDRKKYVLKGKYKSHCEKLFGYVISPLYTYSYSYGKVKEAGVLESWYEEVKEPIVNGYRIATEEDVVKFGCAELKKEWFEKTKNRHIKSMVLSSGVEINKEEMEEVRKYLENV